MNLIDRAVADVRAILEDQTSGFGRTITLTDPSGQSANVVGYSADISQAIDPQTGQAVTGRFASVVISIESLVAVGFTDLPKGVAETSRRPWVVETTDAMGRTSTFKVREATPDRTLGVVSCSLEAYGTE